MALTDAIYHYHLKRSNICLLKIYDHFSTLWYYGSYLYRLKIIYFKLTKRLSIFSQKVSKQDITGPYYNNVVYSCRCYKYINIYESNWK